MRRLSAAWLGLLLAALPVRGAGEPKGKLVLDLWDAAYLGGGKAGFVHTTVHQYDVGGRKVYRAAVDLNLTLKRFKDTIQMRAQTGTDETADGKVVGVFMQQQLGAGKTLNVTGKVVGKELVLTLDGKHPMEPAPWDERVVGVYRQQRLYSEHKVKPGDAFSYRSFEPTVNLVVTTHVKVKGYEEVELFGGKVKRKLLRVEAKSEKIENVQLPTMTAWLGDDFEPLRTQVEIPGLGEMTLYRTTQQQALSPGALATATDIGLGQLIKLNKRLPKGYNTTSVLYRIKIKGDEDAATAFSRDERQEVKSAKGDTIEMQVRSGRAPAEGKAGAKVGDEFMQSSYFITSADSKVKELARRAVGAETDPWKKAVRIEHWVHANMTVRNHEALATADHVARTLEGDCTEYSMLTAAMCRAEGVPSRTAIGLIYADVDRGPVLAFHMWTEVWVRGRWLPLDATLGRGFVGGTHLKITDASWHNRRDLAPLLPVVRVLGKMSIEVVDSQ